MYTDLERRRSNRPWRLRDESYRTFIPRVLRNVDKARQEEMPLDQYSRPSLELIADDRNLRIAWDRMAGKPNKSPGPDRLRFCDVSSSEAWGFIKVAKQAILDGSYRPGPERLVRIPKASGSGQRELRLQNIVDRVVATEIKQILEPIIDPLFVDESCGCRPGRDGTQYALAQAEIAIVEEDRHFVLIDDVRNAFNNVPQGPLLEVLRLNGLPGDVINLIERSITNPLRRGLRQGSPLSPLLLNIYLHHFLDKWWRKRHPDRPLIRMLDDLLLSCESYREACQLRLELTRKLRSDGMPLKGCAREATRNVRSRAVDWLGYRIDLVSGALRIKIAPKAWRKLQAKLLQLHEISPSQSGAVRVIKGWVEFLGPMYKDENRPVVLQRIQEIARKCGFEEIPPSTWMESRWKQAAERWANVRTKVRRLVKDNNPDQAASELRSHPLQCSAINQAMLETNSNDKANRQSQRGNGSSTQRANQSIEVAFDAAKKRLIRMLDGDDRD